MILKYGLVSSIGTCALLFISAYVSLNKGATFEDHTSLFMVFTFVLILVELRNKLPEVSFSTAFRNTLGVSIVVSILSSVMFYCIIKYYDRYILEMHRAAVFEVIDQMEFSSEFKEAQKNHTREMGPLLFTLGFIMGGFIKHLFWSCMISIFLKKEKVESPDEQY